MGTKVFASVLKEFNQPLELVVRPDPACAPDGVIIRVEKVGICGTDAHLWANHWSSSGVTLKLPSILGHEVAGVVVERGTQVTRLEVGDRVTIPFHIACGSCPMCMKGQTNLCHRAEYVGSSIDGGFAQLMAVPRADLNCVTLPTSVSMAAGAALGCRFMTAFRAVYDVGHVGPGEQVVVLGAAGGVGSAVIQLLESVGARVIAADLPGKITSTSTINLNALSTTFVQDVKDATSGGPDIVIDAIAAPGGLLQSIEALRPGGRHIQVGMTTKEQEGRVEMASDLATIKELQILGVSGNPHSRFAPLLALVESGRCKPDALITETVGFSDLDIALASLLDHSAHGLKMFDPNA